MMKNGILNLAAAIVTTASAIGLTALGSAPAHASSPPSYKLIANSGSTALDITANGLSSPVIISNRGTDDNWVFVNSQRWTNLNGTVVQVSEIQHAGTANCINYSQGLFEMSGCVSGDKNELFWADPTGSTTNGNPNYWFINVAASETAHQYIFVTAQSLTNGSTLVGDGPGFGGLAAWNRQCSANC
jgi:hypothetical protein